MIEIIGYHKCYDHHVKVVVAGKQSWVSPPFKTKAEAEACLLGMLAFASPALVVDVKGFG